ncbi:MAG: nucleotidyltransferase family protein [Steroidobacteraceae bacterium]|nr:nucleotidyltransferase family protein [Steroidobacteraceae bacterium]
MNAAGADSSHIHVVVLAAGASTRFGSTKQLVRVNGRPLMHTIVSRAVELAGHSVTVVLGANAGELAPLLKHTPATVAINRDWSEGIASSIRTGFANAPPTSDGILIVLADQIAVSTEDLRRLAGVWRRDPNSLACAQYAGGIGVPAIFPRWCFRELNELRGDRGAQLLLQRHVDRLVRLPMPSAEIDIDRPEDLLALEANTPIKRRPLQDAGS